MLRSLIFEPKDKVFLKIKKKIVSFLLSNGATSNKNLCDFQKYFEDTYLNANDHVLLKLHGIDRLKNNIPITAQVIESFNKTLNSKFDTTRPAVFFSFLRVISTMQHETESLIRDFMLEPNQTDSDIYEIELKPYFYKS
ncbi:hypothetical protein NGRA_1213 [Nosema granulosis]|uniref:Uncharacterized protein n=1 Tax=Nosema granulosis TaxID=83296 RepID=A0A9P6KYU8_9MICR|nr:hypothetical protein NGRA_1213 [Nosema granulosis]